MMFTRSVAAVAAAVVLSVTVAGAAQAGTPAGSTTTGSSVLSPRNGLDGLLPGSPGSPIQVSCALCWPTI